MILRKGREYIRPGVRTRWTDEEHPIDWVPVLGPVHRDEDVVNFRLRHFHADFRFLPPRAADPQTWPQTEIPTVFARVITNVFPLDQEYEIPLSLDRAARMDIPPKSYFQARPFIYRGQYPDYPDRHVPWLEELTRRHLGQRWQGPARICPHRGAALEGIEPGDDGLVLCPLHGLRFDPSTGLVAQRTMRYDGGTP